MFTRRVVADCMTHTLHDASTTHTEKLDACCQYGCDVDLSERDAILARAEQIRPLLATEVAEPAVVRRRAIPSSDPDYPSGTVVRTAVARRRLPVPLARSARLRDPPRVARAGLGLPRREAGDLPAVPAVLRARTRS